MKDTKKFFKKNAIRISFSLVVILTIATVVLTARFVISYSETEDIDSGDFRKQMTTLDMELFNAVTEANETKTSSRPALPTDVRDPFSPLIVAAPSEETTGTEETGDDVENETPAPPPEEEGPTTEE